MSQEKPTVSLCMIVRDEEETLPRAVGSVSSLVDDMVICDTGSRDRTRQVAEELGARVVDYPWADDFAAARNAALEHVTTDWVLVLDADEVLQPVSRNEFSHLLENPRAAGYEVTVTSRRPEGEQEFSLVRLFRNDPSIRFTFPIHEQVVPSLNRFAAERGLQVLRSNLLLRHSGYTAEARAHKRPRNRRLFERALALHPDEPYLHFQAAAEDTLLLAGEVLPVAGLPEVRGGLETAWSLTEDWDDPTRRQAPWYPELAHLLGSANLVLGHVPLAADVLGRAAAVFPEHPALAQTLCLALVEMGLRDFELLKTVKGCITAQAVNMPVYARHRVMGHLELALGHVELARAHYQALLQIERYSTFAYLGQARCCLRESAADKSLALLLKAVQASEWNWQAWLLGAQVMERLNLPDKAAAWMQVFTRNFPAHPLVAGKADSGPEATES